MRNIYNKFNILTNFQIYNQQNWILSTNKVQVITTQNINNIEKKNIFQVFTKKHSYVLNLRKKLNAVNDRVE